MARRVKRVLRQDNQTASDTDETPAPKKQRLQASFIQEKASKLIAKHSRVSVDQGMSLWLALESRLENLMKDKGLYREAKTEEERQAVSDAFDGFIQLKENCHLLLFKKTPTLEDVKQTLCFNLRRNIRDKVRRASKKDKLKNQANTSSEESKTILPIQAVSAVDHHPTLKALSREDLITVCSIEPAEEHLKLVACVNDYLNSTDLPDSRLVIEDLDFESLVQDIEECTTFHRQKHTLFAWDGSWTTGGKLSLNVIRNAAGYQRWIRGQLAQGSSHFFFRFQSAGKEYAAFFPALGPDPSTNKNTQQTPPTPESQTPVLRPSSYPIESTRELQSSPNTIAAEYSTPDPVQEAADIGLELLEQTSGLHGTDNYLY